MLKCLLELHSLETVEQQEMDQGYVVSGYCAQFSVQLEMLCTSRSVCSLKSLLHTVHCTVCFRLRAFGSSRLADQDSILDGVLLQRFCPVQYSLVKLSVNTFPDGVWSVDLAASDRQGILKQSVRQGPVVPLSLV